MNLQNVLAPIGEDGRDPTPIRPPGDDPALRLVEISEHPAILYDAEYDNPFPGLPIGRAVRWIFSVHIINACCDDHHAAGRRVAGPYADMKPACEAQGALSEGLQSRITGLLGFCVVASAVSVTDWLHYKAGIQ